MNRIHSKHKMNSFFSPFSGGNINVLGMYDCSIDKLIGVWKGYSMMSDLVWFHGDVGGLGQAEGPTE